MTQYTVLSSILCHYALRVKGALEGKNPTRKNHTQESHWGGQRDWQVDLEKTETKIRKSANANSARQLALFSNQKPEMYHPKHIDIRSMRRGV